MEKAQDGPQVSTRHAKDRRPSYNNKSARAIASLELRLATLEGRQQTSPQQTSTPKCNAALDLDSDLREFGRVYNELEERVAGLEKSGDDFDERLQPYDNYRQQALDAVKQLKELQARVQTASPSKADSGVSKLVNEHEASLREFSNRLLMLEDQSELAKAQAMSTSDLALALTQRLSRGDLLNEAATRRLRQALDGTGAPQAIDEPPAPAVRQQQTPATDDSGAEQPATQPSMRDNGPPKKRRRTEQGASKKEDTKKKASSQSEPISTPEVESALSSFMSGGLADAENESEPVSAADGDDFEIPPEVRRTSRQPKPTKHNPDMVHWRDANKRVKGMRPSAPSPRKVGA